MKHGSLRTNAMIDPRALAELDAWVAEEVAAIGGHQQANDDKVVDARRWASERGEAVDRVEEPEAEMPPADLAPRRERRGAEEDGLPYDAEEDAFIEATVDWLAGRENADIVLEEIWRRLGGPAADSEDVVVPINLPQADPDWPPTDDAADGNEGDPPESGNDDG